MLQTIELAGRIKVEVSRAEPGMPLFVTILDEKDRRSDYWYERIPADFGVGIRVRKVWDGKAKDFDHQVYDLNLDMTCWIHSCECRGHLRRGHCKHVDIAVRLWDEGLLLLPSEAKRPEPAPAEPGELTYGPEFPEDEVYQALVGVETADGYVIGGVVFDNP